ncbi:MAG: biotin transporter BioY [Clostridiales bacterium]|nr:biotin transporter BioY [Clostridiales bacterium]
MKRTFTTQELVLTGVFTAVMTVLAQISIPITPGVPLTLSVFAVFLASSMLPLKCAVAVQLVYVLLGVAGLPVFAGFSGGFAVAFGPTGGYILSYIFMAWIIGGLASRFDKTVATTVAAPRGGSGDGGGRGGFWSLNATICGRYAASYLLALAVCYLFGSLWLMIYMRTDFISVLGFAALPFLPFDLLKAAFCALLVPSLKSRLVAALPR